MQKTLFLIMFIVLSLGLLYADNTKTFNTEDGGIVEIRPFFNGFKVKLTYYNHAPEKVIENLNLYGNSYDATAKIVFSSFKMKFLDKNGFEICNKSFSFSDFLSDPFLKTNWEGPSKIVLQGKVEGWGLSANKIASVIIDYNQ